MRERSTCPRQLAPTIVVDNGPEFAGRVLDAWAYRRGITLAFIQPGKPTQDAFVESFNSRLRDECLDRKSTRLNSSHGYISYAVFCLKKNNCDDVLRRF